MPDIKIFVSRRIDVNSRIIENPLYIPVRCGAVFDKENNMGIIGDDTGDNISEKRMSLCEFTVQYWAWKNFEADYYGLCHYRRYLSFSDRYFPINEYGLVRDPVLCPLSIKRYGLTKREKMEEIISGCDAVVSEPAPVNKLRFESGRPQTVWQLWAGHDGIFFERKYREMIIELIDCMSPEYSTSAREYFASAYHRGYNCYILKKELFQKLCELQFPIMFEMEKRIDTTEYTDQMRRTPAFIGEMLYGVFIYHILQSGKYRIKERQLVFFEETEKECGTTDYYLRKVGSATYQILRAMAGPIFPMGSQRREWLKKQVSKIFE